MNPPLKNIFLPLIAAVFFAANTAQAGSYDTEAECLAAVDAAIETAQTTVGPMVGSADGLEDGHGVSGFSDDPQSLIHDFFLPPKVLNGSGLVETHVKIILSKIISRHQFALLLVEDYADGSCVLTPINATAQNSSERKEANLQGFLIDVLITRFLGADENRLIDVQPISASVYMFLVRRRR